MLERLVRNEKLLLGTTAILLLFELLRYEFTIDMSTRIRKRDNNRCTSCNTDRYLTAAHIDHTRGTPWYNTLENGRVLCKRCHYLDHYQRAGTNGLTLHQNLETLLGLWGELSTSHRGSLPHPDKFKEKYGFRK